MHILVLNGSPKGEYSITLQTVRYLEKLSPADTFEVLHVGQKIKSLEKDFAPAAEALDRAELLLFSYPVYTFLAPSQLHRFIELVKQHNVPLAGKFATLEKDEYLTLLIHCIELLRPDIVIHRVTGDGPKNLLIAPTWSLNKRDVLNSLHQRMRQLNTYQGRLCAAASSQDTSH